MIKYSLMSNPAIQQAISENRIYCDPFNPKNLNSNSYDITLGEWYWRERGEFGRDYIYNPYDEGFVRTAWKLHQAQPMETDLVGISQGTLIIIVQPGETILGHTQEFIGSCCRDIVPSMRGRSSTARNRIKICSDAGLGDIGYCNRWTMEITNFGKAPTILVVGRRIGQIQFFETAPIKKSEDYVAHGKYQITRDIQELKNNWSPDEMLPKQWLDWEVLEENARLYPDKTNEEVEEEEDDYEDIYIV